jgi:osmotically-inducible protein OsmY
MKSLLNKNIFFGLYFSLLFSFSSLYAELGNTGITAGDQSLTQKDTELTSKIRRDLLASTNLSTDGKNIKIISQEGKVTLKGEVDTRWEKEWIEKTATRDAGPNNVTSELTVKTK